MIKKIGIVVLFFILVMNLGFRIWNFREEYSTKYDSEYWRNRYLKSQWVDPKSKESIGDDGLYAYAGWAYIHGQDPTMMNAEMPPLGKYLIGLSILVFHNQNIFSLLVGILCLLYFYKINKSLLKSSFLALLPVVFISFEPLFYQQLRAPYLDTLYFLFLLLTFFYFLKGNFLSTNIFLGMAALTKNSVSTFILLGITLSAYLLIVEKKKFLSLLKNFPFSVLVFLLGYSRYFLLGHNLREFMGVQKWILNFYAVGAKGAPGMVFPMFINLWQTWWNGVISISEWQITWPITLVLSILYFFLFIIRFPELRALNSGNRERSPDKLLLIVIWLIVYLLFLSFIPVWPRYFLLIIPFLYLLSVSLAKELLRNIIR